MPASPKKRLIVLDTHAILHRAYHALPDFSSSKGEPTGALFGLVSILVKIINDLRPDYIAAAFDLPGGTFRDAVYKDYKATRSATDDALSLQINRSRDVLKAFGIPLYEAKNFEADDVVGTIVEQVKKKKDLEVVIASGDMDTLQLVEGTKVRVFTLRKGLTDTVTYDEEGVVARYGFGPSGVPDLKGIAGDPSDNIKGVRGVGEGSALKLLQVYGSLKALYAAIKKEGVEGVAEKTGVQKRFVQLVADNKEDAEFSKLLATIRRDAPITFELPTQTWREGANPKVALNMLAEFEFRALVPRVKTILGLGESKPSEDTAQQNSEQKFPGQNSLVEAEPTRGLFGKEISAEKAEDFQKAQIAASVLDTTLANPELEDILRMGKSDNFDEAVANLHQQIQEKKLEFVYEQVELPLSPVLRRMEERGIKVDKKFLSQLSREYTQELGVIAKRIYTAAGGEFNVSSPKQLGEILFDKLGLGVKNQKKTAGGARSTRESELLKLKDQHPIIEDILSYRELSKLLSTYIDALPTLLDANDRVHTHFIQMGAATGRLASQNPNLQNIPIKTELGRAIRRAFIADEGSELLSFDYSQIELRIAALLSGDDALQTIFRNGRDVHAEVAARVFGVDPAAVTYEQRRRAKVINFGILYGMGVSALQQSLGTKRAEAQEFYNQYFAAFPRLAEYMDETKGMAATKGYTQTYFGRRRYFEGIKSPIPYVRAAAERMALNAPFQGTSADLIKLAMVEIDKQFPDTLVLQVHDELLFEIKKEKVGDYAPKIKHLMESVIPEEKRKGVPLTAEGKHGKNWGEMEPL